VYVNGDPAVTVAALAVLVTFSSAFGAKVEVTEPVLFPVAGSGVDDDAVAVFVKVPMAVAATVPTTVMVAAPPVPAVRSPSKHDFVAITHEPALVDMAVAVKPAGRVSASWTARATDGPALVTVIVYVAAEPGTGDDGTIDLATETSAEVVTDVEMAEELLVVLRSSVVEEIVAVFASVAPAASARSTVVTIVNDGVAPIARLPTEQVTVVPLNVQAGDDEAGTKVTPTGSLSVITVAAAAFGPALAVVRV
jgi:hypothetical protein